MNAKLITTCALLWLLGLLGMGVSRALFDLGPGALSFELCARFWVVGGTGYLFLGMLDCRGERDVKREVPARCVSER